jgi:hypothetical protein
VNTETRRIRKILRRPREYEEVEVPPLNPQRQLTYALTKPRAVKGFVTLTQLAAERGMQAQLARIYMHRAKIRKPGEHWRWEEGSKTLKRVRKALGLSV